MSKSGVDNVGFQGDNLPDVENPEHGGGRSHSPSPPDGSPATSSHPDDESPTTSHGHGEVVTNGEFVKSKLSDPEVDIGLVVYTKGTDVAVVELAEPANEKEEMIATRPYAGMGKEDLLRFSDTPFWNRFRLACTIIFWIAWFGLVGTVIGLTITYPRCKPPPPQEWWKTSVYYQIYVRSFYDSDGDGVGDINGIREKLEYLDDLRADTIILSSFYQSQGGANPDYGYEVLDHKAIDPIYGSIADFKDLLEEAHGMGIRVVLDFIPNFTGSDHQWFAESRSDSNPATNPKWNYYVWAECAASTVPNNWQSVWGGGPAWTRNAAGRQECYLHQFLETQPELNLRSASVQQELEDILRFWLEIGVDGFRVNNVKYLYESADLQDEEPVPGTCSPTGSYDCLIHNHTTSLPEIHDIVNRWRTVIDEYTDGTGNSRALITDAIETVNATVAYFGQYGPDGANLPINYQLTSVNTSCDGKCTYQLVDDWLYHVPEYGTSNWLTGTQDLGRIISKIQRPATSAIRDDPGWVNAMTMLKLTLPGAPIVYYGEEIGMSDGDSTGPIRDPVGLIDASLSRDQFRTPMQWLDDEFGGFMNLSIQAETGNDTWLPVNGDTNYTSVEAQEETEGTPLYMFKELVKLRNETKTLIVGHFYYSVLTENIISYIREYDGHPWYLTAINFGNVEESINFFKEHYIIPESADVIMTTRNANMSVSVGDNMDLTARGLSLKPGDGVILTWPYVRPNRPSQA